MTSAVEANFDGLVGPTHNYGGLAPGNLASARNEGQTSAPRQAVLEGVEKAKRLADAGFVQGFLPPQERPFIPVLKSLGFTGTDEAIWEKVWQNDDTLARNLMSASCMWAANAATVSPSADTSDSRLHFTPANLLTALHRSIEGDQTERALSRIFADPDRFAVHPVLPMQSTFADEGAANHIRLCTGFSEPAVEIFVYGRDGYETWDGRYPARQTLQSCQTIARRHGLDPTRTVYIRQSRQAIEAGAFHNDVVSVGNGTVLFFHEQAFEDKDQALADIRKACEGLFEFQPVEVPADEVPLEDAVKSYLFNSQLLSWPGKDRMVVLAPNETEETGSTRDYCERLVAGNGPIGAVEFADVRQSMRNGGGPACLRLRVVLTKDEHSAMNPSVLLDDDLYIQLKAWAERHYRDTLHPDELSDPMLLTESRESLDALTSLLDLGGDFYPFQR